MSEDESEDMPSSSTTSFIYEDELEMPIDSFAFEHEDEVVDPFMYCSPKYFALTRGMYDLMIKDLSGQVKVTLETLCDVARGAPLNLHAWRRMKSRLVLGNAIAIYLKVSPNLQVIDVEK